MNNLLPKAKKARKGVTFMMAVDPARPNLGAMGHGRGRAAPIVSMLPVTPGLRKSIEARRKMTQTALVH